MANNLTETDLILIDKIASFINEAGIECKPCRLSQATFLPAIDIQNGGIIYDPEQLKYPGDLLHEAGHLAVPLPKDRKQAQSPDNLSGDLEPAGAEMAAIAWSWAAATHLNISAEVLFHEGGYKGASDSLIENFSAGKYIGVPMLQWFGMTKEPKRDTLADHQTYPKLIHWLRQG